MPQRGLRRHLDEMRCPRRGLAAAALWIGAGHVEIAQSHERKRCAFVVSLSMVSVINLELP